MWLSVKHNNGKFSYVNLHDVCEFYIDDINSGNNILWCNLINGKKVLLSDREYDSKSLEAIVIILVLLLRDYIQKIVPRLNGRQKGAFKALVDCHEKQYISMSEVYELSMVWFGSDVKDEEREEDSL